MKLTLNDREQEVARWLAKRFEKGGNLFDITSLCAEFRISQEEGLSIIQRFDRYGFISAVSSTTAEIEPTVMDVVDQLENPPLRDYWAELAAWFRSKRWSVLVVILLIVLPLLVQWVEMLGTLLRWLNMLFDG